MQVKKLIEMEVIKTDIEGVVIVEPRIFKDSRGYFFESYSKREFDVKVRPIDRFCTGQRVYVYTGSNAWTAFPVSTFHTK